MDPRLPHTVVPSGRTTRLFFAVAVVALLGAFGLSISDNPPGLLLVYVAVTSLMLALVHHWRSPKRFLVLAIVSLLGFPMAALLHNLLYGLGEAAADTPIVPGIADALHVGFFLVAVFVCPVGVLVGAIGALVAWRRGHHDPPGVSAHSH
jgi:hypothetical protein